MKRDGRPDALKERQDETASIARSWRKYRKWEATPEGQRTIGICNEFSALWRKQREELERGRDD